MINIHESQLIPAYKILGCKPEELCKYSQAYILAKLREYYSSISTQKE